MTINEFPSVPTPQGEGRDNCPRCNSVFAALDAAGIVYEVIESCVWCGVRPIDPSPELEGCCSEDCRYQLARDEGFVSDTEHAAFIAEGWAS